MVKLYLIRTHDAKMLEVALKNPEAEILLLQDGVLLANKGIKGYPEKLKDRTVYVFEPDAVKRGLSGRLVDGVQLVDVGALVDLLFSGVNVINL